MKPGEKPKQAPKIHPQDCIINWDKHCYEINNLVRGLAPSPGAKSYLTDGVSILSFKIFESQANSEEHNFQAGKIFTDGKQFLKIACGKGFLKIDSLQLEGKRKMNTGDFLRGFSLSGFNIVTNQQV